MRCFLLSPYRNITVDDEQLLPGYVKLTAQLVGLPVDDAETFVVWIKNGLQKLQFGLQTRHRHLPRISGRAAGKGEKSGLSREASYSPAQTSAETLRLNTVKYAADKRRGCG